MNTFSGAVDSPQEEEVDFSENSEVDALGDISPKADHSDNAERRCRSSNPFPTCGENTLTRAPPLPTAVDASGSPKETITNEPDTVHEAQHAVPARKGPRDHQKKAKNEVKRGSASYIPGPADVLLREIARRSQLRAKRLTPKQFTTRGAVVEILREAPYVLLRDEGVEEAERAFRAWAEVEKRLPNFDELYNSFSEPDIWLERALRLAYAQAKALGKLPAPYYTRTALDVVPESNANSASASGKLPATGIEGDSSAHLVVDSQRGSPARKRQRRHGNPAAEESRSPTNSVNVDNFPLHQVLGITPLMASCHQTLDMVMWSTLRIENWSRRSRYYRGRAIAK
ncbi:hypothetical protein PsorP6_003478 [Peronosclerospora sorghi]|uniref:Uncharacterized protein n=1 Tax=Peronosclerospora sorghi TaxID=230839 RepID=A0ACC0VSQ5_9STRA|nr:hypothetical protein PsorP6_003478 [Peronosclerospora sorghi]